MSVRFKKLMKERFLNRIGVIRLSAHILIASAHTLIVFLSATNKAATMKKHTPPQSLFFLVGEEIAHCPPTVPSGDTPCVTVGDAQRANPWRVERERKKKSPSPHSLSPEGTHHA